MRNALDSDGLGDLDDAIDAFRRALAVDRRSGSARRGLADALVRAGRREESFPLWHTEVSERPAGIALIADRMERAMREGNLGLAGEYAAIHAALRWGSLWHPPRAPGSRPTPPLPGPTPELSIGKLEHDCEQFLFLQRRGILGAEFSSVIESYRRVLERLYQHGSEARERLAGADRDRIGHVYNRIVHHRDTPRVARALSGRWDPAAVEDEYLTRPPGIVVVDDFLSEEALAGVRAFCLESTVWSTNRYGHGRLGSFFRDGFHCPLLIQIAEELRAALPRVIGDQHPVRQVWGFKYPSHLPARSTHADFAAVNVNFWITPDEANLDPGGGGMVIHDVVAPLDWDFATYNRRSDLIHQYLESRGAGAITIPYRQNRVVIFNSDLFHSTSRLHFRSDYELRRVNVTVLYGDRENAAHRRGEVRPGDWQFPGTRR